MDGINNKVDISVIISVYNGGEFFKKNIESVSRLKIPDDTRVEFLFVDNNSTDGSGDIIKEYTRKYPDRFRYFFEPKPGKSYALNLGIREAKGDVLAFTDADTILPEDWLLCIKEGFERHDCAALGGRVLPVWEVKPPAWLMKDINAGKGSFALEFSEKACYYSKGAPSGSNNAVKKECFQKYGDFRTDLGPRPGFYFGGEDTEFFQRIISKGKKVFYYPPMIVYHQIPKKRFDEKPRIQKRFLFVLHEFRGGTRTAGIPKTLLALPETLFKLLLSSLGPCRVVPLSTVRYLGRLQKLLFILGYRTVGEKNIIRLAVIFRLIDRNDKNNLLNS